MSPKVVPLAAVHQPFSRTARRPAPCHRCFSDRFSAGARFTALQPGTELLPLRGQKVTPWDRFDLWIVDRDLAVESLSDKKDTAEAGAELAGCRLVGLEGFRSGGGVPCTEMADG